MAEKVTRNLEFENIDGRNVKFANFKGEEKDKNPRGKRNFCIEILDEEFARELKDEGWNIYYPKKEREDGTPYPPHLKINLGYNKDTGNGPRIMMEQAGKKVWLNEDTVKDLDDMEIIRIVAMEVRPYNWETPTGSGVSAWLNKMRVEVAKDIFCD